VSESRYVIRPKADRDLDDQAYYYATEATPEVGHRFLLAAHSRLKHPGLESLRVFRVNGFEKILILYLPLLDGVEILRVVHGSRNLQALLRRQGLE
jgi:plasmid stabilization system protein ParE